MKMKFYLVTVLMIGVLLQVVAQDGILSHLDGMNDANLNNGSGLLLIGQESGINLVIDRNEILARNNGSVTSLFLNIDGGLVKVGNENETRANLWATGYTKLGDDSSHPYIRTKKVTGRNTSGSPLSNLPYVFEDFAKVLSIQVMYEDDFGGAIFYKHRNVDFHEDDFVALSDPIPNGKDYKMYIVYEQ